MNPLVIVGAVALFLVLALLLLSLNLTSLWRWWIKAGAIVVTLGAVIVLYFTMTGLIGWASPGDMPKRFSLLATRIVEPDKLGNLPGAIYLWIEEVDDRQIVISPPRAFQVPYKVEIATEVASAQQQIEAGGKVLGQFAATGNEQANAAQTAQQQGQGAISTDGDANRTASGGGEGGGNIGDPGALSFSQMPPVDLPDKAAVIQMTQ
ncbi:MULTISPECIES: hypothetical protein [unclassified Devosia]|mgnify:CR=1 FL=1|jgi:hypothetical protein|uniref:hypothetical protein n=1 Tax=unclassified Devosia TaxID=196773 RepID=UPI00086F4C3F|nr:MULTISPECIES: hypothetical protein [unclassified Devosia]MBN9362110.1 hypothetical protein [Devosia sp.]ODS87172.1 MAG: hypothetical protein ABS47_12510 [Devosia sp. SCN 66-27]OJX24624.1 MAG: hypothetical protein BGO83_08435 [Devosia sp. 66-14]